MKGPSEKAKKPNEKMQVWIDARKRHHLSHAHVQMARELGMNAQKLGKLDNHHQEPWKAPLNEFIEHLYFKRFGKERPDVILSIEDMIRREEQKRALKRAAKALRAQHVELSGGESAVLRPEALDSSPDRTV
jgi:hypothetical protein